MVSYVEKTLSPFEQFVVNASRNAMVRGISAQFGVPGVALDTPAMREVRSTLRMLESPPEGGKPFKVVAYCFCEL